ncbi:MAG: hypothetical protein ACOYXT_21490 [Bacteroidota bacterium]
MNAFVSQLVLLSILALTCCNEKAPSPSGDEMPYETAAFKKYWYSGIAEIDSYTLSQSRYGEQRKGEAVLIFVTEDLSKKKQVKLDDPDKSADDKVSVLKMNFTKNFITGIYPYSMMLSVFKPVNQHQFPSSLKVTMSSQEWCGQVFTQMNLEGEKYKVHSYSYFEKDGDTDISLKKVLLEDEIWNTIRIDHTSLPTGEIEIIPGLFFTRLNHVQLRNQKAHASKSEDAGGFVYTINFIDQQRKLTIHFEKGFPHKITAWEEEIIAHGNIQRTSGILDKTLYVDYWTKNKNEFQYLRDSLGLD